MVFYIVCASRGWGWGGGGGGLALEQKIHRNDIASMFDKYADESVKNCIDLAPKVNKKKSGSSVVQLHSQVIFTHKVAFHLVPEDSMKQGSGAVVAEW